MANDMKESPLTGGISFKSPSFSFINSGGDINSGFSFDLPLAAIQSFQQSALTFTQNNSSRNQSFLDSVISRSQSQVTATADRAYAYQTQALRTLQGLSGDYKSAVKDATKRSARGCFITTAICRDAELPDDCDELQTLRKFRDTVMYDDPELRPLISQYYEIAPGIVSAIEARDDADKCWAVLRDGYLYDAIDAVKKGEYRRAVEVYREMVEAAVILANEKVPA